VSCHVPTKCILMHSFKSLPAQMFGGQTSTKSAATRSRSAGWYCLMLNLRCCCASISCLCLQTTASPPCTSATPQLRGVSSWPRRVFSTLHFLTHNRHRHHHDEARCVHSTLLGPSLAKAYTRSGDLAWCTPCTVSAPVCLASRQRLRAVRAHTAAAPAAESSEARERCLRPSGA
jgi:hypothetical protein